MVSISSLIYRSAQYADAVYGSLHEFTPMLRSGDAEFTFVANDATPKLLRHLEERGYHHVVQENPRRSEAELFASGYGKPEYIHRVYRGWNRAIREARGNIVVLVNSDNLFSPNWLESLLEHVSGRAIVCSQLVERKHPGCRLFPGAYRGDFGTSPADFDKEAFLTSCQRMRRPGTRSGGAYMPCAFLKSTAEAVGGYPEGNLAGRSFDEIAEYGDRTFFKRLAHIGVLHVTALDSLVFHFKEGEMKEEAEP